MAISWGPITESSTNGARVGVDLTVTRSGGTLTRKLELWIWTKRASYKTNARYRRSGNVWSDSNPGNNFSYNHTNNSSDWPTSNRTRIGSWTSTRSISLGQSITTTAGGMIADLGGNIPSGPSNGWIVHSRSVTVTRPANPPSAPGRPSISNLTSSGGTATWTASSTNGASIIEYQFLISRYSDFRSEVVNSRSSTSRTRNFSGLSRATTYYARVRARNSAGWGNYSSTRTFTTPAEPPSAPGTPTSSSVTSSGYNFSFSAPSNNGGASILEYQVQRARASNFTTGSQLTSLGTSRSGSYSGLTRATDYWQRARARNSAGWGAWSSSRKTTTLPEVPSLATVPAASRITRNSAYFSGFQIGDTGGQSPTNLRIQYNTSQSTTGASIYTRGSWAAITLSGLAADQRYYYRASAYNSAGWGPWSGWQNFTTLDDAPDDMSPPTFTEVTETSFRVNWTAPAMNGATFSHYVLNVAEDDEFTFPVHVYNGDALSRLVTGLDPGTRYYVRVMAEASPNSSGWGESSRVTAGRALDAGLRMYIFEGGVRRELTAYTFIDGVRHQIRPMYAHDGQMETR